MNSKIGKIGAFVIVTAFLISSFVIPLSGAMISKINKNSDSTIFLENKKVVNNPEVLPTDKPDQPIRLDSYYVAKEDVTLAGEQNDIGYNCDTGDKIVRALPIYVGEPIDPTVPGRGRTGTLDQAENDEDDWYRFTACQGQTIEASVDNGFSIELADSTANTVSIPYTVEETGIYYVHIFGGNGDYTLSISLNGQNDANTGGDAGNSINAATPITPGSYTGYMSYTDTEDWYSFSVNSGDGIFVTLQPVEKREADYDIHLYNPSGMLVHSAQYYGEDELEYPADESGTWKIKIDMFPGWDENKWPDNYFLYGSGAYELTLSIGGSAEAPPGPIPQPDIIPVAQTFKITNDPNSNRDEYAYISAIPAANYLKNGERYVSPIVYQGVDTITSFFGTVDDTTQYLLDDWNTYLSNHGLTAVEYHLNSDPIKAAAEIATLKWSSSDTAVLVVDGSRFEDTVEKIIEDKSATLNSKTQVITLSGTDKKLFSDMGYTKFLSKKWCAIALQAFDVTVGYGDDSVTSIVNILPKYLHFKGDWWPTPYDGVGDATDLYFPITQPGIWSAQTSLGPGKFSTYKITLVEGDRYTIPVTTTDCSLKVTITSDEPNPLRIYLVDPKGNIRRPMVPHYNGGEINPIHYWNGGHWENNFDEFRAWEPTIDTVHSEEVHHPMIGKWTAIVVPGSLDASNKQYSYTINAEIRKHSAERVASALSAANGAVIASLENAPLLYVTEDSVPSETQSALSALGVSNIIFVNINEVSSANPSGSVTEYTTMKDTINKIKSYSKSENFITITSLATGDGYFAPAAMIAAYHGGPVLNIGEIPDVYNTLDSLAAWREYAGDYYHGANSVGHPPKMSEPIDWSKIIKDILNGKFPSTGFDMHLTSYTTIHDGIVDMITNYGLEQPGKEAYLFVAPRDGDIRNPICRAMTGVESYAGHIPVETPAFASAHICRDILYPAIIFANPGRDVTSSCLFNFADGRQWTTNDGKRVSVYTSRALKRSLSSHGRFYEGHSIWENLLERYNSGCAVLYHCSHGTGGSGICCMYKNIEEQFPLAEPRYEHLKDFNWWDGWRGYMYDDAQTKTPRWGGFTWSNAKEPNLYDIVHFKWCDQLFDNLHSQFNLWQSCTTGEHLGPIIYLEHGAALWYGNAESGLCPQEELFDEWWFTDMMENGVNIGESLSKYIWQHQRDYTAKEGSQERDISMYGSSSLSIDNCQVLYGDPTLICYSPEWIEPTPTTPQG